MSKVDYDAMTFTIRGEPSPEALKNYCRLNLENAIRIYGLESVKLSIVTLEGK